MAAVTICSDSGAPPNSQPLAIELQSNLEILLYKITFS